MNRNHQRYVKFIAGLVTFILILLISNSLFAADVVTNGDFNGTINNWIDNSSGQGTTDYDGSIGGVTNGSARGLTDVNRNRQWLMDMSQSVGNINATDQVLLSLYWYKWSEAVQAVRNDLFIRIIKPSGDSAILWTHTIIPEANTFLESTVPSFDVSSSFDENGTYTIKLVGDIQSGNNRNAFAQCSFDDIVLDVQGGANNPPTVSSDATQALPGTVDRTGSNTTTISTAFADTDQPGVGAFNVTFKVREPDNSTEVTLVNNLPNGSGGLTITDDGGGNYTASYTWDPGVSQALGTYDLYFEVSDGTDNAVDGYTPNADELTITEPPPNNPPIVSTGATQVSVASINKIGANSTVVSADFTDSDQPVIGAFNCTFKIKDIGEVEYTLVNNQPNGSGGLTIIDNGSGSYTASYTYDPGDGQATGDYDLYFEVSDGTDNAIDNYANNDNEFNIYQQYAPTIVSDATVVTPATVNRFGANTTTISTDFTDIDQPGIGAFTVTFKIREPNNVSELTLVNNQPNGGGGLTITDNGGGSYTADYTWDPGPSQTLGLYDLYCEVSDGTDNAIDDYTPNADELTVEEVLPNNAPTVAIGATQVSVSPVNRYSTNSTVISTDFNDTDQPGIGAFTVTFKIREPNNVTELTLVNNQPNGGGGLTIVDNGGGSYTASYSYNPDDAQTIGLYDLFFEVIDGIDNAIDDYAENDNELEINEIIANNAPTVVAGATQVSVSPVNRYSTNSTVISTDFNDTDQPGIGAFTVTFKIREPNNVTELTLVNNQPNGGGGLTIVDNGGGSYTASYSYNPDDAQTIGLYDLFFEVSDGIDNAIDDYADNDNELEINEVLANNAPTIVSGATQALPSTVNRVGSNTTVLSTVFSDTDVPGVGTFNCTFKVKDVGEVEYTLVNNLPNGGGGLTITDQGGGSYMASYTWDPGPSQVLGTYDLYFEVNDGTDNAIDDYTPNADELTVEEVIANNPPTVTTGVTYTTPTSVNRFGSNSVDFFADFDDEDDPGQGAFTITFKIREPNNTTELILVNNLSHGSGGLTVTDNGGGSYTASYTYDPDAGQTLGLYDLFFEVSDGSDNAIDVYDNNLNDLQIYEDILNSIPSFTTGITSAVPGSVDRAGSGTTTLSSTFIDADQPGIAAFYVTFKIRPPFGGQSIIIADSLQNGQGGLTIIDNSGGSYTASISYDPSANATVGYYDLFCQASDGSDIGVDSFDDNLNELLISNGGENASPVVPADNVFASPAGVERIGANPTMIAATFSDGDIPGVSGFKVSFKLRLPNNVTEIVLADNVINGAGGVFISDLGGGLYTASIDWDPPDAQVLGFYDLYFHVTDNIDTAYDAYANNLDELQIYDAISNNGPTLTAGTTTPVPVTINRIGSEFAMIKASFSDVDMPGIGAFVVTLKVRDNSLTEYTLLNAAHNKEQDLRIRHLSGTNYEASVLWDPPVSQTIDDYDLYFYVEDNFGVSATDDYADNLDELAVTSAALTGDGYLLRRTHNAAGCGDSTNGCHLIIGHQGHDCLDCHEPHGTQNIYVIKDSIQTPTSGLKEVIFKTLGIGDPYNDPDPTVGDASSGAMADDTDGAHTGVCEVCHTSTTHHNNDDTHSLQGHHNAEDCTGCHPHEEAFANSGGGESSGGDGCSCHSSFASTMATSGLPYHHKINSENADYNVSSKTCLMCHVHHDIFRDDLNSGFGQRAKNLRADITTSVVQGSAAVLSNSDYSSSGAGGICLSCHTSAQTKTFTRPDGSTETMVVSKAEFDAADAHNYNATSTFATDGSTFNGNCVKCHNDDTSKSYQNSTNKFAVHNSTYRRILAPFNTGSPTDPLEENSCFGCHSGSTGNDYYSVATMTSTSQNIQTAFTRTYAHPTTTYSGRHAHDETSGDLADGNRHAECLDCHNPHAAAKGTHDGTSNLVSNALKGVWGVEPISWANPPTTPTDNANVFDVPGSFSMVDPATKEYQICLKCHSNYTTLPTGSRNLAEEINPYYPSSHAIVQAGDNAFCNSSTMNEPWATNKINYCSDCHRSDVSTDPEGPHGSNADHLLVASIVSDNSNGTPLCYVCHMESVYWTGSATPSDFDDHPSNQGQHYKAPGCFSCHMWDHSSTGGLGLSTDDWPGTFDASTPSAPPIKIWIHGQNRKWVYNEQDGSAGSGQPVENFINGYIANMDHGANRCWTETCKVHSNKAY